MKKVEIRLAKKIPSDELPTPLPLKMEDKFFVQLPTTDLLLSDEELTALTREWAGLRGEKVIPAEDLEWLLGLISKLGGAVGPFSTFGKKTTDRFTRIQRLLGEENVE